MFEMEKQERRILEAVLRHEVVDIASSVFASLDRTAKPL